MYFKIILVSMILAATEFAGATPVDRPRVPDLVTSLNVDPHWPQKPAGYEAAAIGGIAVDNKDLIWVYDRSKNPIQVYDKSGKFIKTWGSGIIDSAHFLRFDNEGNVWAVDVGANVVRKFTDDGKLLLTLGTPGELGDDDHHFNQPTDVAITPKGDIFVSDGYGNSRIVHFDKYGKFIKAWGKLGSGPGEFDIAHSIVLGRNGLLYVADRNNARIQVFDQKGKFITQWQDLLVPFQLCLAKDGNIWAAGAAPIEWKNTRTRGVPATAELAMKLNLDGKILRQWAFPIGRKPGEVDLIHAMAVDSDESIYIGDVNGERAQKFVRKN